MTGNHPMKFIHRWAVLILIVFQITACAPVSSPKVEKIQPFSLEPVEGSDLKRIILTEKAVERLDIQTLAIREEQINGVMRKVTPYASIIYDLEGATWVYINPSPFTYVRESVTVDFIDGDNAVLKTGPSSGTEVVVIGVAELWGTETGLSK
jgi:hypothetical protein